MDGNAKRKEAQPRVLHRELSWLQFNHRVQMEADNPENPLLERAKYLAIVTSNLDEFMQVRYHRLLHSAQGSLGNQVQPCGLSDAEALANVNKAILRQQNLQYMLFEGIHSELYHQGIQFYPIFVLSDAMRTRTKEIFLNDFLPKLKPTPWTEELSPISQKKLHLIVRLRPKNGRESRCVSFSLPSSPRVYELPSNGETRCFIRQEDLVKLHLNYLFPEERVEEASVYRILRNQDFPIDERMDVATGVREMLLKRRTGQVMRLEAEERMGPELLAMLMRRFELSTTQRYRVVGPLDLGRLLMTLYGMLDRPELKYARKDPVVVPELVGEDLFAQIAQHDWLLYHPYHSFEPVINLFNRAALDPDVCSIKTTLYRVGTNSPIVRALLRAVENGKQVTVLFESRARFDEENNLAQGDRLKRAGCTVLFGIPHYKTHSKIALITRMEDGNPVRYLHLGTGNYHDGTAKLYTDMGLLTTDPQLGEDAARFFYGLEGNGTTFYTSTLAKAPEQLKPKLLDLIEREKLHALNDRPCGIIAKMNSLLDPQVIEALYSASCVGVPIDLIVRGICTLIPGIPAMSEHIRVISIVGRHLEHARAFQFTNGGEPEVYLSSADWMPRNLDKRVELMFPLRDAACARAVENVLALQLADSCKCWRLASDGGYVRQIADPKYAINAQERLLSDMVAVLNGTSPFIPTQEDLSVQHTERRNPT